MENKPGQVTIFIILGVLMVSAIALFFLFKGNIIPSIGGKAEQNPNTFLKSCLEDKIQEGVEIISLQGGYIENPLNIYFKFEDESIPQHISYLCYTQNNNIPCINQEPMLIKHLEEEIHDYLVEEVESCFNEFASSLERQSYVVDADYREFKVNLIKDKIVIEIDAEITLTKSGETTKQKDFSAIIPSKIYNLGVAVQGIINDEVEDTCVFDPGRLMIYQDIKIDWKESRILSKDYRIYRLEHLESDEGFRFAVRGCVI